MALFRVGAGTPFLNIVTPPAAVLGALALGSAVILVAGASPVAAYRTLAEGAFGSLDSFAETLVRTSPLLFAGLGVGLAIRCGVWNIGAEGQLYMGALVATWFGITFTGLPSYLIIPMAVVASFAAGGIWGVIPGWLKAKMGVSEIINTIMMNYIAIFFVSYLVTGPMQEANRIFPQSPTISQAAQLPILVSGTRLHSGIVMGLASAIMVYLLIWRSTLGYEIRAVGLSPEAARSSGINVAKNVILAMLFSGGLAGMGGMVEILGLHHRLLSSFSPGYGYTAIAVALLGRLHPLGVVLAAFLFGILQVSGSAMQRTAGVPIHVVYIIEGLVVLFLLVGEFLHRSYALALSLRLRRSEV